jgi:hypothetical protein
LCIQITEIELTKLVLAIVFLVACGVAGALSAIDRADPAPNPTWIPLFGKD